MVTFDYLFDAEELKKLQRLDFKRLTGRDLDYYLFCGSIFFRADHASLDAPWRWIPLIDFCVRLNEVMLDLSRLDQAVLEFTENEETIAFERRGEFVYITADYAHASASVPLQELRDAVTVFSGKLMRDVTSKWPALLETSAFKERLEIICSCSGDPLGTIRECGNGT